MNLKLTFAMAGATVALLISSAAQAATVDWTQWATSPTLTTSKSGTIGGVNVSFSGESTDVIFPGGGSFQGYIPNSSFLGGPVGNVPANANGAVRLIGGGGDNAVTNTITFSQALINPVFLIWSLGQNNYPTTFNFQNNPSIAIVAGGATSQYGGNPLTLSGSTVQGIEGNGVVQFAGSVSSISWTNPTPEFYYAFTVGNVTAVPEPGVWALMIVGFGLAGAGLRRRRAMLAA